MDWQTGAAIATVVSTVAFAASAIVVVLQLRQAARERYFAITAHLFELWQSPEFQHDQLFLLHKLSCSTWDEFCALGRGEHAERALHRVGGYYDRVGNLIGHDLIRKDDILPTIGGYAVAVWDRIQPLVKELRLRENAVLFQNYESLLPECHDCYVPGRRQLDAMDLMSAKATTAEEFDQACAIDQGFSPCADGQQNSTRDTRLRSQLAEAGSANRVAAGEPARSTVDVETNPGAKPNEQHIRNGQPWIVPDLAMPDTDGITHRISEFSAIGKLVLVYAKGHWCPFCLRQLSDYGDCYGEFKGSGIEVVAVLPDRPRDARRARQGLKLPLTVLCDEKREAARALGLLGREPDPNAPAPATMVLDAQRRVHLSAFNDGVKCLFARDVLEFARSSKQAQPAQPSPPLQSPRPGPLFIRALTNMAAGFVSRQRLG